MSEHSPLPWVLTSGEGPDHRGIETFSVCFDNSPSGMAMSDDVYEHQCVARVRGNKDEQARANAEFIVRAVNSHEALVKALKVAHEILGRNGIERPEINAALAQAEGQ